ncbi:NAD(P)H-binding protein [Alteribacillus sp. YIM 98480]|uniref:NAD(P)H-binding protein n=1 Tax=Alteribacillus sp. YIM 98480 TaxID=2606599 RepID=UPI00131DE20A|nr:NAD(P)H-binding protein [Alteribacillus sp. YIM 98480]
MKKALVLGASGSMGNAITFELVSRGVEVAAFARNKKKLDQLFGDKKHVQVLSGDVFNSADVIHAATDADVIFHAINIPYPEWAVKQHVLLNNILQAAKTNKTKLALVDNIYAYGRSNGNAISEEFPKKPHTKKGRIRLELEKMAKQSGVPVAIAHFPDFYGPQMGNTLLHYTFQSMIQNKRAMFVGNQEIAREYIYTPDGAKAIVELALHEKAYGKNWNIPGYGTITGKEIVQIAKEHTQYTKKVRTVTKSMIRCLGLFNKIMREYVEMYYLNETPVVLSGKKYEQEIGSLPRTSYREGIFQTLQSMKQ